MASSFFLSSQRMTALRHDDSEPAVADEEHETPRLQDLAEREILGVELSRLARIRELLLMQHN